MILDEEHDLEEESDVRRRAVWGGGQKSPLYRGLGID